MIFIHLEIIYAITPLVWSAQTLGTPVGSIAERDARTHNVAHQWITLTSPRMCSRDDCLMC